MADWTWHIGDEPPEEVRRLEPELLWTGWAQGFTDAGIDRVDVQEESGELVRVRAHLVGDGFENEFMPGSLLEAFEKIRQRRRPPREPRDFISRDDPPLDPLGPRDVHPSPPPDIDTAGP
jgi:hypothetical protein